MEEVVLDVVAEVAEVAWSSHTRIRGVVTCRGMALSKASLDTPRILTENNSQEDFLVCRQTVD